MGRCLCWGRYNPHEQVIWRYHVLSHEMVTINRVCVRKWPCSITAFQTDTNSPTNGLEALLHFKLTPTHQPRTPTHQPHVTNHGGPDHQMHTAGPGPHYDVLCGARITVGVYKNERTKGEPQNSSSNTPPFPPATARSMPSDIRCSTPEASCYKIMPPSVHLATRA